MSLELTSAEIEFVVVNSRLPKGVETKTFAITVEPETGSQLPTSTPIMLGDWRVSKRIIY